MMIKASQLAQAGFAFLGRAYKEMDCQEFVERCLAACGLKMNLRGSNAWFREMTWTGSPEECCRLLGAVPVGAFLFIWNQDGGEVSRGYHDGLGNAGHIGICTGEGKGAIHSSETRGCVAESAFSGRSVPGGWNCVGLWNRVSYDPKADAFLTGLKPSASDPVHQKGVTEEVTEKKASCQARVIGDGRLNMRTRPDRKSPRLIYLEPGTVVTVMDVLDEWSQISCEGKTGYVQSAYLEAVTDENTAGTAAENIAEAAVQTAGETSSENTGEMVPVPRKQLERFYNELGNLLGLRG